MIDQKIDGLSFVLNKLKNNYDLASPVDKNRLLDEMMGMLVFVTNIAIQDHYLQIVSDSLKMSKQVLEAQLKQYIRKQGRILRREMEKSDSSTSGSSYKMDGEMLLVALIQ
jgi:DNA primase